MTQTRTMRRTVPWLVLPLGMTLATCGGRAPAPEPGDQQGRPPDLRGVRVMVLPVQEVSGVEGNVDAELAFGLQDRGEGVGWIVPDALQRAVDRSPGLSLRIRGLPVGMFLTSEVRRVGDPLYGDLRRLGELVDARVALIPVRLWAGPATEAAPAARLATALLDVRTGRVLWFGVVEGDGHAAGDPRLLASAVDELARTLLWYVGG